MYLFFQVLQKFFCKNNFVIVINIGDDCESEVDVCFEMFCFLNRQCMDLSLEEEFVLGRGYNCLVCFLGYDMSDDSCLG